MRQSERRRSNSSKPRLRRWRSTSAKSAAPLYSGCRLISRKMPSTDSPTSRSAPRSTSSSYAGASIFRTQASSKECRRGGSAGGARGVSPRPRGAGAGGVVEGRETDLPTLADGEEVTVGELGGDLGVGLAQRAHRRLGRDVEGRGALAIAERLRDDMPSAPPVGALRTLAQRRGRLRL